MRWTLVFQATFGAHREPTGGDRHTFKAQVFTGSSLGSSFKCQHSIPSIASECLLSVEGNRLLLSWIERSGDAAVLKFSDRGGTSWSAPHTVANGSHFLVNWADVPSVVRLADGTLAAHWLVSGRTLSGTSRLKRTSCPLDLAL